MTSRPRRPALPSPLLTLGQLARGRGAGPRHLPAARRGDVVRGLNALRQAVQAPTVPWSAIVTGIRDVNSLLIDGGAPPNGSWAATIHRQLQQATDLVLTIIASTRPLEMAAAYRTDLVRLLAPTGLSAENRAAADGPITPPTPRHVATSAPDSIIIGRRRTPPTAMTRLDLTRAAVTLRRDPPRVDATIRRAAAMASAAPHLAAPTGDRVTRRARPGSPEPLPIATRLPTDALPLAEEVLSAAAPGAAPPDRHAAATGRIGMTIGDQLKYRIESLVASGGFGAVYVATCLRDHRRVAVKFLHPDAATDPALIVRFWEEARVLASIHHPHIVRVEDFGVVPHHGVFLVMEYLDGQTLSQRLRRQGPLSPALVIHCFTQIALALDAAHQREICHRDLKPANVICHPTVKDPHAVKLCDFGIMKLPLPEFGGGGLTAHGMVLGTTPYLAPEYLAQRVYEPRSDLYALGVMGYELLTGRRPFPHKDDAALVLAHLQEAPPPLRAPTGQQPFSPRLSALIMRLLAKDPADRPASAVALRAELSALAEEYPLSRR